MPSEEVGRWIAKVVAIEDEGEQRPYVSLDDLERLAADDQVSLGNVIGQLRVVFESWRDRTGGVFVRKDISQRPPTEQ